MVGVYGIVAVIGAAVAFFCVGWVVGHLSHCPPTGMCDLPGMAGLTAGVLAAPFGAAVGIWITKRWLAARARRGLDGRAA